ncbi:DNA-binding transcriptional ArsR family regulator [Chitinophaga niastensis]|uniref:DNA-binding transcriptional ArsR family regulator n=1 Tax=Chitinophaga niastensis TaxID=536980 RepID=A0A2P8HHL2_CHINA|nr:metalloregulator ArsR/SmtB family transcription factor [Chitinophaga niastensis]PSL45706.1 DNA-binding transcriptional ArsR family regulator [Chitinophaga niastensis]
MRNENVCIREDANPVQISEGRRKITVAATALSQLSSLLSLAGNEVRLKILYLLDEEKELCPCDLSDMLNMTIPAVSQHLRKLKDGGMVTFRRSGQTIFYSLRHEHIKLLRPFFKLIDQTNLNPTPL